MHRSMKESEPAQKVTSAKFESRTRIGEASHTQQTAQVHAHEKATVPQDHDHAGRAVKKSVGHYIEHTGKASGKGLRKERY